MKWRF